MPKPAAVGIVSDPCSILLNIPTYIGAHPGASLERDLLEARPGAGLHLLLGHVAQRSLVLGNLNLEIEARFQIWLVEARECSASIAGLELGAEHVVELVVPGHRWRRRCRWLVLGSVEPCHDVVHGARELDGQCCLGGPLELLRQTQRCSLRLVIVGDLGGLNGYRAG